MFRCSNWDMAVCGDWCLGRRAFMGDACTKIVPAAKDQPAEEHLSEAVGHMVWNTVNQIVISDMLRKNTPSLLPMLKR